MRIVSGFTLTLSLCIASAAAPAQTAPGGVISRIAGCGTCDLTPDGTPALSSRLTEPCQVAVAPNGEVYFTERMAGGLPQPGVSSGGRVRKITADGKVMLFAGNGRSSFDGPVGDGLPATSVAVDPQGIAIDTIGNVYISDRSSERIRRVAPNGIITTLATVGSGLWGGMATDAAGNVYACNRSKVIKVTPTGTVTTIAGGESSGYSGDGGPATAALLTTPNAVAVDLQGNVYISDEETNRIRKVSPSGTITTVAGNGVSDVYAPNGDGGQAILAAVPRPNGVAVDAAGNIFISQWMRVRRVAPDGIITTAVGRDEHNYNEKETANFCCTGLLATSAQVEAPEGITVDAVGSLYIANGPNENMILKVTPETYAGGARPTIQAVVNAADYTPLIAPYTWISIMGTNLAPMSRGWADLDFVGGALPQQLDGVRVYVEGWPTMVSYISPTQINALVFHGWEVEGWRLNGEVVVEVANAQGRSNVFQVERRGCAPAVFRLWPEGAKWAVAQAYSDGALIGPPNILPGVYTRPAKAGDILTVYGTGFGQTNPATPAGVLVAQPAVLAHPASFRTEYVTIRPDWAGLTMAGLYQFNFVVPPGIPDGEYKVEPQGCQGDRGAGAWVPVKNQQ